MTLEIGTSYHIFDGKLDFSGTLLDIYDDGTVLVQSNGTGSNYRIESRYLVSKL